MSLSSSTCVLLLLSFFSPAWAITCHETDVRVRMSRDLADPTAYNSATFSNDRLETCDAGHICGYAFRSASLTRVRAGGETPTTADLAYSGATARCTRNAACNRVIAGADSTTDTTTETGCRRATIAYSRYYPLVCNADLDFMAVEFAVRQTYVAGCCATDECTFASEHASSAEYAASCAVDTELSTFLTHLHVCWSRVKYAWRRYFLCHEDGIAIADYAKRCTTARENGNWDYRTSAAMNTDTVGRNGSDTNTNRTCFPRPRCRPQLRAFISTFAQCACAAARVSGRSGEMIAPLMQELFDDYCPNIEFECETVGDVSSADRITRAIVRRQRRRRRARFRIAQRTDAAERADIIEYLRDRLQVLTNAEDSDVDDSDFVVTFEETTGDGRRRRLLADEDIVTIDYTYEYDSGVDSQLSSLTCGESLSTGIEDMLTTNATVNYIDCSAEFAETILDNSTVSSNDTDLFAATPSPVTGGDDIPGSANTVSMGVALVIGVIMFCLTV